MDQSSYIAHCRRRMLESAMKHISEISDDKIMSMSIEHADHHGINVSMEDLNRMILESDSPAQVDVMLGCTGHDLEDSVPDLQKMDEEIASTITPEEIETEYGEIFHDILIEFLRIAPNSDIMLSYSFIGEDDEVRGSTMIFGRRDVIDILMDECETVMDECEDESGFVNSLAPDMSDDEIEDLEILRRIEEGESD